MDWTLEEAIALYKRQGAPRDQSALVSLLKEVQRHSGTISQASLRCIAEGLEVKETYLTAVIRRIPSLRLEKYHVLEVCAGPNCGKHTALAAFAESLGSDSVTVKFVPCMRQCGKGPNVRYDGRLYHQANEALLRKILKNNT